MYFRDALLKHRSYNYTPETTVVTTTLARVRARFFRKSGNTGLELINEYVRAEN